MHGILFDHKHYKGLTKSVQKLYFNLLHPPNYIYVEFVNHDWQLKQTDVIFIKISLKLSKIFIKITSSSFICQSWLTKPRNKSQECFENGTNSSCPWHNSFFLLTLLSCQKQGPKSTISPFFWVQKLVPLMFMASKPIFMSRFRFGLFYNCKCCKTSIF